MRQTACKEVLGCSQMWVGGSSSRDISSAQPCARPLGFRKTLFNALFFCPEHPRAWSLFVRVSAGLDQGLSISSPLFSLPNPLGWWEPGGFCCGCPDLGRKEPNPLCWVEVEHPTPTLCPPHGHPMATPCPSALPGTAFFRGSHPTAVPWLGGACCAPPALPAQLFLRLFFFLPPNTTNPPNPPQLRNLFLFLFSLCFLPRQSIDWS